MRRVRLNLTGVGEVLKESAEKKLEQEDNIYEVPKCSNGNTAEFYNDLNMPLPPDLVEKLKVQDNGIIFGDDDYEAVTSHILVYEDQIKLVVTDDEFTTVFLEDGITITILETAVEIDDYLDYVHRNLLEKFRDSVSYFLREIKRKLNHKNNECSI